MLKYPDFNLPDIQGGWSGLQLCLVKLCLMRLCGFWPLLMSFYCQLVVLIGALNIIGMAETYIVGLYFVGLAKENPIFMFIYFSDFYILLILFLIFAHL